MAEPTPLPLPTKGGADNSLWTYDSLYLHLAAMLHALDVRVSNSISCVEQMGDQRYAAQQEAIKAAQVASATATTKADNANEKRLDAVNEWRATVVDLTSQLIPRKEAEQSIAALTAALASLEKRFDAQDNRKQGTAALVAYLLAGLGALGIVTSIVMNVIK